MIGRGAPKRRTETEVPRPQREGRPDLNRKETPRTVPLGRVAEAHFQLNTGVIGGRAHPWTGVRESPRKTWETPRTGPPLCSPLSYIHRPRFDVIFGEKCSAAGKCHPIRRPPKIRRPTYPISQRSTGQNSQSQPATVPGAYFPPGGTGRAPFDAPGGGVNHGFRRRWLYSRVP